MLTASHRSIGAVFHPTDFSKSSHHAFNHALRIALSNKSRFDILNVFSEDQDSPFWSGFPSVRQTLERWALLDKGSPREAVADKLGIKVRKVKLDSKKPLAAIASFLDEEPSDLIVLATEGREGLPRWLNPSVSERLSRRSRIPTLFVPAGTRGFTTGNRGEVDLRRILIPVDHKPDPQAAIDAAGAFLRCLNAQASRIDAVFVGEPGRIPEVGPPTRSDCSFERSASPGNPVDEIVRQASETKANLIVMATEGRNGFLDAVRGSTTEQVLRRAPCPLLAVPAR